MLRRGDWISGPEAKFKRDDETGFFDTPHFFISDAVVRGDAAKLVFGGPDKYEVTDGRYATCVAPATIGMRRRRNSRSTRCGW